MDTKKSKIYLLKLLLFSNIQIGKIINFFKKINKKEIKIDKILVNRCDRLGDAIVSLPFLLALKQKYSVDVISSEYNDFIFRPFFNTYPVKNDTLSNQNITKIEKFDLNIGERYDLFIDLVGLPALPIIRYIRKNKIAKKIISSNYGVFNFFVDCSLSTNFITFSKTQLIENYQKLLEDCCKIKIDINKGFDKLESYVSSIELPEELKKIKNEFILVFVGGKDYRMPNIIFWKTLISFFAKKNYQLVVIDDPSNKRLNNLKKHFSKYQKFSKSIIFVENKNYTLWQLLKFSMKSKFTIGFDSGGFNFIRILSNSVTFYTTGNYYVWRPYGKIIKKSKKNNIFYEVVEYRNKKHLIIHGKDMFCRPCLEILCKEMKCVKQIENPETITEIIFREMK